jgi:plastocyanin
MKHLRAVTLVLVSVGLTACGSGGHGTSRAAAPNVVVMRNIAFNPQTIHAKVGQTITWINRDDAPHNVTYSSGPRFASSATFTNGESFRLKLTKAGTIRYMCTVHPGMNGTIVVAP